MGDTAKFSGPTGAAETRAGEQATAGGRRCGRLTAQWYDDASPESSGWLLQQ
jgi:hypothetical protein